MTVAIACVGLLGLLLFVLGLNVSRSRGAGRVGDYPTASSDPFFIAIRAHGNTAEYAPMLAILILIAGERNPSTWVLIVMIIAVASRYLVAAGMLMSSDLAIGNPFRLTGAVGTYLSGIVLCIAVLLTI